MTEHSEDDGVVDVWFDLVEASVAKGRSVFPAGAAKKPAFDAACKHIAGLLRDAELLFHAASYPTAVFLAVTAIEEVAKAHVGLFREGLDATPRGSDPLFSHRDKHQIAAAPSVVLGGRLQDAIGKGRVDELLQLMHSGELVNYRERSIYCELQHGRFTTPADQVDVSMSRDIILLAVEVFDDALVGFNSMSLRLSAATDLIFRQVAAVDT